MNRAYSVLNVKEVQEEQRIISGTATTPKPDRMNDIVEPLGVKFKNPMPLLHQHDRRSPVGLVKFKKPTEQGIEFEATLPKILDPGPLRDRVETAWLEVKNGLIRAVSIGFRILEDGIEFLDNGGLHFTKTEVFELSLVTIPAHPDAMIDVIRSIDAPVMADKGIVTESVEEIIARKTGVKAPQSKSLPVVKLQDPARDSAKPYVIKKIHI